VIASLARRDGFLGADCGRPELSHLDEGTGQEAARVHGEERRHVRILFGPEGLERRHVAAEELDGTPEAPAAAEVDLP
jgi:hypothetical protein